MPLYTVMTQTNSLSKTAKAKLAADLTSLHSEFAGVPKSWVHVVFLDFDAGSGFSGGEVAPTVTLTALIRSGRSSDYKRELLTRIWALIQGATDAPDDQIVIGIQELDASNAMEMGRVMPDVASQ